MPDRIDRTIPAWILHRLESVQGRLGSAPGWLCPAGRLSETLAINGYLEGIPLAGIMDGDPSILGQQLHGLKICAYGSAQEDVAFVLIASTEHHLQLKLMLRERLGPNIPLFDLCETAGNADVGMTELLQGSLAARAAGAGLILNPEGAVILPIRPSNDWIFKPTVEIQGTALAALPTGQLPDLKEARRILWMQPHGLGDLVISGGALPLLREKFPDARIDVLMREQARGILDTCPFIDSIISFEAMLAERDERYLGEILGLLRARTYDLVLNPLFLRRPLWDLCAVSTRAPVRVALGGGESLQSPQTGDLLRAVYTHVIPNPPGIRHASSRTSDFLAGLGIHGKLEASIWLSPEAESVAESVIQALGTDVSRVILLFGSAYESWRSYGRFGEALALTLDPVRDVVIACGERRNRGFHQSQLDIYPGRSLNLCGELSLQESLALLAKGNLMVGADSGPAHAAAALGVPHVVVAGGGQFGVFFPWHPLTTTVVSPLECFGCQWLCPYESRYCLDDIGVDAVVAGIRQTLGGASSRSRVISGSSRRSTVPRLDLSAHVNTEIVEVLSEGAAPLMLEGRVGL